MMQIIKKHFALIFCIFALTANAEVMDCNGSGTVNIWLGTAADAVISENPQSTKRLKEIVTASKKNDGGKSAEKIANLYNCTVIVNDPDKNNPEGMYVYVFSEKKFGSSIEEKLQKAVPNSFQFWAHGGSRRLMSGGTICYEVKYKDEQGNFLESGYLKIDTKIPFPEKASNCN